MEFETRVLDPKDFEELKKYSSYYSEITKVMVFETSAFYKGVTLLDKYFKISSQSPVNKEDLKYIIDMDDHKKMFLIAPDSYISFCSGVKPKGSSIGFISYLNLREIYILLKYGLVEASPKFKQYFSPLSKDCALVDLHAFQFKKAFRKDKAWTFEKYFKNEIEKGKIKVELDKLTSTGTKIFEVDKEFMLIQNEVRGEVVDINYKSKKAQIKTADGRTIQVEYHGWHPFNIGWVVGKEIRLLYKKIYGDGEYKKIIDPIVLPEDIKIDNKDEFFRDFIFISNRRFPTDLFNKLYYEYKIRTLEV